MKKLLVIAALFLLWAGLSANVFIPRYIARVWFDDSNACHLMFSDEAWWEGFDVSDLRGRFLSRTEIPLYGLTHWELPDLSSGICFISMAQNDRILARSRITIFK